MRTQPEKDGERWEFIRERRLLVRVHPNKRSHLFRPEESKTIPIPIKRIGFARTTIYVSSGVMDFIQDNWKKRGSRPVDIQWTGKTFFRVFGPYDTDYEVEASEVCEALTDFDFVGQEKMGDYMVSLVLPKASVVSSSRTTKPPSGSWRTGNHLLFVTLTKPNRSTCRGCLNSIRRNGMI